MCCAEAVARRRLAGLGALNGDGVCCRRGPNGPFMVAVAIIMACRGLYKRYGSTPVAVTIKLFPPGSPKEPGLGLWHFAAVCCFVLWSYPLGICEIVRADQPPLPVALTAICVFFFCQQEHEQLSSVVILSRACIHFRMTFKTTRTQARVLVFLFFFLFFFSVSAKYRVSLRVE